MKRGPNRAQVAANVLPCLLKVFYRGAHLKAAVGTAVRTAKKPAPGQSEISMNAAKTCSLQDEQISPPQLSSDPHPPYARKPFQSI